MDDISWTYSANGNRIININQIEMITLRKREAYDGSAIVHYSIDARMQGGVSINLLWTEDEDRAKAQYSLIGQKLGAYALIHGESRDDYSQSAKEGANDLPLSYFAR